MGMGPVEVGVLSVLRSSTQENRKSGRFCSVALFRMRPYEIRQLTFLSDLNGTGRSVLYHNNPACRI